MNPKNGSIKVNFPELEPGEMVETRSCALDVADRGPQRLEDIGPMLNVTRERARQIEEEASRKLRRLPLARELNEDEPVDDFVNHRTQNSLAKRERTVGLENWL